MIKKTFKILVILISLALIASAQTPFYYELSGTVNDAADGTSPAGRTIRFYRADREDLTEGVAAAIVQNDGSFSLNIFDIWPDNVVIGGNYRVDVPIENGYGVPVTQQGISISGKGYDLLAEGLLALMTEEEVIEAGAPPVPEAPEAPVAPAAGKGNITITLSDPRWENVRVAGATVAIEGIGNAADRGEGNYLFENLDAGTYTVSATKKYYIPVGQSVAVVAGETASISMALELSSPPNIRSIRFGNRLYQPVLVGKGEKFVISAKPKIIAILTNEAESGISSDTVSMVFDIGSPSSQKFEARHFNVSTVKSQSIAGVERASELSISMDVPESALLSDGSHTITFSIENDYERAGAYTATVEVMGGPLRIVDLPLTFPSPFSITKQGTVTVQYTLSADADIEVYIMDVGGSRVKKFVCESGSEGGSAGMNKITWDGMTAMGLPAGNAIYMGTIVARREGRLLGKFKLTIVD